MVNIDEDLQQYTQAKDRENVRKKLFSMLNNTTGLLNGRFESHLKYAEDALGEDILYDKCNGRFVKETKKNNWTKEYIAKLKLYLKEEEFSKELVLHLLEAVKVAYPQQGTLPDPQAQAPKPAEQEATVQHLAQESRSSHKAGKSPLIWIILIVIAAVILLIMTTTHQDSAALLIVFHQPPDVWEHIYSQKLLIINCTIC